MALSENPVRRGWRLALCLSLLIHAGIGFLLSRLPDRAAHEARASYPEQSWYTEEDDYEEMKITLVGRTTPAPPAKGATEPALRPGPESGPGADPQAALINPGAIASEPAGQSAGQGPGQGGGPRAGLPDGVATTFFDVAARGRFIVYLIDASSSMGPSGGLALAGREVLASVRRLPADVKFQVLTYNSRVTPLLPRYPDGMPAAPLLIGQVAEALRDLEPVGATDHARALREALTLRPDVLFFLTDADDLTAEHLRTAAQHNRAHTTIHVIELTTRHRGRPDMPMQRLARAHGGTYQAVDLKP
jgi:hypothetical protein